MYSIARLMPNFITVMALFCGMMSVRSSLSGNWEPAMWYIVIAGLLDMLDGRVARMLRVDSQFGAQLDSLCDLVNFGICPALVIYMWGLNEAVVFGWALVVVYVTCMALRLARFNSMSSRGGSSAYFFTGVPAPAGATLVLLPVFLSLASHSDDVFDQRFTPLLIQLYTFIVSLLLVSPIPTFSIKHLKISKKSMPLATACFALAFICFMFKPWVTLPVICVAYLMSIPCSAAVSLYINRSSGKV